MRRIVLKGYFDSTEHLIHSNCEFGVKIFDVKNAGRRSENLVGYAKGQLISKCPFGVFKSAKISTKFFPGFLPLKRGKIKKVGYESQNKILQLTV